MTDIFSSALQLAIWSFVLASSTFAWSQRLRIIIFIPLVILLVLEFVVPIHLDVPKSLGALLNIVFRLGTLAVILVYLFGMKRRGEF